MDSKKVYAHLEKDFIKPELSDDWVQYMGEIRDFLCENFKKRSMGLVCDNTSEINSVYTAVFPSEEVMKFILKTGKKNILLFVHHPSIWDIRAAPKIFFQMNKNLLEEFKKNKISIYNLHVPLDNYSDYSTSKTLAKKLGLKEIEPFAPYFGGLAGVIGKTKLGLSALKAEFEKIAGHKTVLYNYGTEIKNSLVGVTAGGGNQIETLEELKKRGINTFITGVSIKNDHSKKEHDYAKENKINILGGTHYSTEKFACIKMCEYFKKIGLPCEFIEDKPILEDM